ncbi:hypothetical protein JCM4814A_94270 [Streptomyces phaeofaciens JCM 4814]|uniref:Uncharacterized protein n=1 Tax=Streptomyces phaeofaciens TaxID=68254 RepID=A0A918HRJ0_9ACTN|nr:hypothetical protein GCM10010226_90900 [Streptomyces phaeofaciens]
MLFLGGVAGDAAKPRDGSLGFVPVGPAGAVALDMPGHRLDQGEGRFGVREQERCGEVHVQVRQGVQVQLVVAAVVGSQREQPACCRGVPVLASRTSCWARVMGSSGGEAISRSTRSRNSAMVRGRFDGSWKVHCLATARHGLPCGGSRGTFASGSDHVTPDRMPPTDMRVGGGVPPERRPPHVVPGTHARPG